MLEVAQSQADYVAAFKRRCAPILIRRYAGTGAARSVSLQAQVLARVLGYKPDEIVGDVKQGDRRVIALNDPNATVPMGMVPLSDMLPLSKFSDRAVIGGNEVSIEGVDDEVRRLQGTLLALEIQIRG